MAAGKERTSKSVISGILVNASRAMCSLAIVAALVGIFWRSCTLRKCGRLLTRISRTLKTRLRYRLERCSTDATTPPVTAATCKANRYGSSIRRVLFAARS
jgi:hypothetical protein